MLQRIDDQFRDDEPQAGGLIGCGQAPVGRRTQRDPAFLVDHGGTDAVAKTCEIGAQFDPVAARDHELTLQGGNRYDAMMRIAELQARFFQLDPPRALHEHAGDDLEAVGDTVLQLLQENFLLLDQVVLDPGLQPFGSDVGDGQHHERLGAVVFQLLGVQDDACVRVARAREVHLIGIDGSRSCERRDQKRAKLRDVPLAFTQIGKRGSSDCAAIETEGLTERFARPNDTETLVEEKHGTSRRSDESQCETWPPIELRLDCVRHDASSDCGPVCEGGQHGLSGLRALSLGRPVEARIVLYTFSLEARHEIAGLRSRSIERAPTGACRTGINRRA